MLVTILSLLSTVSVALLCWLGPPLACWERCLFEGFSFSPCPMASPFPRVASCLPSSRRCSSRHSAPSSTFSWCTRQAIRCFVLSLSPMAQRGSMRPQVLSSHLVRIPVRLGSGSCCTRSCNNRMGRCAGVQLSGSGAWEEHFRWRPQGKDDAFMSGAVD